MNANCIEKAIPGTPIELATQEEYNSFISINKSKQIENFNYDNSNIDNFNIDNLNINNFNQEQNKIELDLSGIAIYTNTYGSLEALIQFVRADNELPIPIKISQANISNVMNFIKFADSIKADYINLYDKPTKIFVQRIYIKKGT